MPETITIGEIKKLIEQEGISPSDIFGRDSLIDDPIVKGYVDEERKMASSGEYAHRKRTDAKFDEEKKDWEKDKTEKDEEIKKLKVEGAKRDATELFSSKIKERKLDKPQSEFLKSKQGDFSPEDLEALDKEVDKFMDAKLEEFKETAKIFGHKTEEPKGGEPKGGGEPGEGGSGEDNELIPD